MSITTPASTTPAQQGTSREFYRGLIGRQRAGVHWAHPVAQDAQRTDAMQRCDNPAAVLPGRADARPDRDLRRRRQVRPTAPPSASSTRTPFYPCSRGVDAVPHAVADLAAFAAEVLGPASPTRRCAFGRAAPPNACPMAPDWRNCRTLRDWRADAHPGPCRRLPHLVAAGAWSPPGLPGQRRHRRRSPPR